MTASRLLPVAASKGGRASHHPEAVALAKRLRRASPKTGERRSLRDISALLAEAGHLNEHGRPYNPRSIKAMNLSRTFSIAAGPCFSNSAYMAATAKPAKVPPKVILAPALQATCVVPGHRWVLQQRVELAGNGHASHGPLQRVLARRQALG